jgi:signal transduction histidine kinase
MTTDTMTTDTMTTDTMTTDTATGHGIRGMRERAAAAGGTIEAGPMQPGGFRVAAWFPC